MATDKHNHPPHSKHGGGAHNAAPGPAYAGQPAPGAGAAPHKAAPPVPASPARPPAEPTPGPATEATAEQQVVTLQGELDDLQARLLRVTADYQNFARRTQRDLSDARQQQLSEVARALLGVLDHFDRALEADTTKGSAQGLIEGVKMVRDELIKMLEQFGIRKIEVKPGDPFDPARHEALMHQTVEGVPPEHIGAQLQPGYTLGDRILRPAKVSVAP